MKTITIYGDSIMRATVPGENDKYQFKFNQFLEKFLENCSASIVNRSQFGATISKGLKTVERDISKGVSSRYALVEYGGNDCNFDWAAVASEPDKDHAPATCLDTFVSSLEKITSLLEKSGVTPVLMTLPPINAERYFKHICKGGLSSDRILHWLGGDVQLIYRFHELYSDAIAKFAMKFGYKLIDVRSAFLTKHNLSDLISGDGIHPSEEGYDLICSVLESAFSKDSSEDLAVPA